MPDTTSAEATLAHHLQALGEGIDAVTQDFAEDSVVITPDSTCRGLGELRTFFTAFLGALPECIWDAVKMIRQEVTGELAYILWEAKPWVLLGTDTLVVRNGKIVFQTFASYAASESA